MSDSSADELDRPKPSLSETTTPRPTKRHAHFEDSPDEDDARLRRTNTAPSLLRQQPRSDLSLFDGRTTSFDPNDSVDKLMPGVFSKEEF